MIYTLFLWLMLFQHEIPSSKPFDLASRLSAVLITFLIFHFTEKLSNFLPQKYSIFSGISLSTRRFHSFFLFKREKGEIRPLIFLIMDSFARDILIYLCSLSKTRLVTWILLINVSFLSKTFYFYKIYQAPNEYEQLLIQLINISSEHKQNIPSCFSVS